MDNELRERLLAEARRHPTTPAIRGRLMPHREAVLTHRAKGTSYEGIAAFFKRFGLHIEASAVGHFCRTHCSAADVERVRRGLIDGPSVPVTVTSEGSPKRRSSRIARDDL